MGSEEPFGVRLKHALHVSVSRRREGKAANPKD